MEQLGEWHSKLREKQFKGTEVRDSAMGCNLGIVETACMERMVGDGSYWKNWVT